LTAAGGEGRDLISTKCSFLSFYTSASVSANDLLASATDASASCASLVASAACKSSKEINLELKFFW
jgi:hypothetical protein